MNNASRLEKARVPLMQCERRPATTRLRLLVCCVWRVLIFSCRLDVHAATCIPSRRVPRCAAPSQPQLSQFPLVQKKGANMKLGVLERSFGADTCVSCALSVFPFNKPCDAAGSLSHKVSSASCQVPHRHRRHPLPLLFSSAAESLDLCSHNRPQRKLLKESEQH